jgi:hypothetical protein
MAVHTPYIWIQIPLKPQRSQRVYLVHVNFNKTELGLPLALRLLLTCYLGNRRREIYTWLARTDPSDIHNRNIKHMQSDAETCQWILKDQSCIDWITRNSASRFFWIHGIPGSGKTILASFLFSQVDKRHCNSGSSIAVYYYCYFGHNQDESLAFLSWVLCELCRQTNQVPEIIVQLHAQARQPTMSLLLSCIEEMLGFFDHAYIVLDAIDESREPRSGFLSVIETLSTDSRFSKIQLLATSREYLDIEEAFQPIATSISMSNEYVQRDIKEYVHSALRSNRRLSKWPVALQDEIEVALAEKAKGM